MAAETEILVAIIGALASAGIAIGTYFFTRNKEINMNINNKRFDRYDDLLKALTTFVKESQNTNARDGLILAYYRAGAYASVKVLNACVTLLKSVEQVPPGIRWKTDETIIDSIYNSIRQDVFPKTPTFPFRAYHVDVTGMVNP